MSPTPHEAIGQALIGLAALLDAKNGLLPFTAIGGTVFLWDNPTIAQEDPSQYTIPPSWPDMGMVRSRLDALNRQPVERTHHEALAEAAWLAPIERAAAGIDALCARLLAQTQSALHAALPTHTTLLRWAVSTQDQREDDPHGLGLVFAPLGDRLLFEAPIYAMPQSQAWSHQHLRLEQVAHLIPPPADAPTWHIFKRNNITWTRSRPYQARTADEATRLCAVLQWPDLLEDWNGKDVYAAQKSSHPFGPTPHA